MAANWIHFWCIVSACLCALSCSLLGTFLVLRRMSLLGDAISHAILPGLALAFLITETRAPLPMFIGAAACGLFTAFISQFLHRYCRVDSGAALGVVFTSMFALGVLLIRIAADKVDLDPGCVLYGLLEFTPFDTIYILGIEIPRSVSILLPTLIIVLTSISLLYKELKLVCFDPIFAETVGINSNLVHFVLMTLVASCSVAAFESVGSILVVAMFIIPAASARLLTDSFPFTLLLSGLLSITAAFLGYDSALSFNTSVAGAMATVSGVLFLVALLVAPKYGITAKTISRILLQKRVIAEDILGLIYRCEEKEYRKAFPLSARNISSALDSKFLSYWALSELRLKNKLTLGIDNCYLLTELGRAEAKQLIRTHRLWETYLVEQLNLDHAHVHTTATTLEHFTSEEMAKKLARKLGNTEVDPHGRKIPD